MSVANLQTSMLFTFACNITCHNHSLIMKKRTFLGIIIYTLNKIFNILRNSHLVINKASPALREHVRVDPLLCLWIALALLSKLCQYGLQHIFLNILQTLEILFFRSHLEKLNNGFCFPLDFKSADDLLLWSCVAVPLTRNNKILVCFRMNIRKLPSVVPLTKTIASSNTSSSAKKENTTEHLRDLKDLIPG